MAKKLNLNFTKSQWFIITKTLLIITISAFIIGCGYSIFLTPQNITPAGFTGIANLISELFSRANIIINPSIIYFVLNAILMIFAFRILGLRCGLYTIYGFIVLSVFMEFTKFNIAVPDDKILCAIFGGLLMGAGVGFCFTVGTSTGGSEIVVSIFNKYFPNIKTGQILLVIHSIVLVSSIFVFGLNSALYALIAIFVSSKVTDFILNGTKSIRAYYIVSDKHEDISRDVINHFHRGVTISEVTGVYSNKKQCMLLCLVTRTEALYLKKVVKAVDPCAFMFSTNVQEIMSKGFVISQTPKNKKASTRKTKVNHETKNDKMSDSKKTSK